MKKNGYYGIGIYKGKTAVNYGTLFRTAQLYDASFVFVIGQRFKKMSSDTMKSWRHIPVYSYLTFAEFKKNIPYDCRIIGIELDDRAVPLKEYKHPKKACYLLGAEDHGLSVEARNYCKDILYLPGERSLNVAVAGSIVMYDRIIKLEAV